MSLFLVHMAKRPTNSDKRKLDEYVQKGYKIYSPSKHHTFQCEPETLAQFKECAETLGVTLKQAITEAMELWLSSKARAKESKNKPPQG